METGIKTWSSSNTAVATVDAATGVVTALAAGTTTISYTTSNYTTNSVSVTVHPAATAKNPTYNQVLQLGETTTAIVGVGLSSTATYKSFTSETPGIATVNATTGQVTAVGVGTSIITYVGKDANGVVIEKGSVVVTVHPAAAEGAVPTVPAPSSVIGWGSNPTGFTTPVTGQTIRWSVTDGTGKATINATSGAVRGVGAGDVTVVYKITETATGIVAYKSIPVTVTIPNTPRVNTSTPYVDGGTIPGNFVTSTNVNLTGAIQGENSSVVTFSNPRSSDSAIATATISNPNPTGHVFLNVAKIGSGPVNITFDYTDIHGTTGTMTWTFNFQ